MAATWELTVEDEAAADSRHWDDLYDREPAEPDPDND